MESHWDVIVAGGGAAGLSAALMLGRAGRKTLVVDSGQPRNRYADRMHGVLGHDGRAPSDLIAHGREEVLGYGVELLDGAIDAVDELPDGMGVRLVDGTQLSARALVVATGMTDRLPEIPGLAGYWGTSVLHCPYCHGWEVRGRRLGVLALPPMGLHQAELLRQWSDDLVVFTAGLGALEDRVQRRLRGRGVRIVEDAVVEVVGNGAAVTGVRTAAGDLIELDAIFTAGTAVPHDEFLHGLDLKRSDHPFGSFIAVDETGRTSHDRVWAIGNVVNPGANVPASMGAGSMTGAAVNAALVTEDFDRATDNPGQEGSQDGQARSPAEYWEGQYAASSRRWSGRVNTTTADVVGALPLGSVLELGSGEGGDAVWLAEQGWSVTAVDISPTAIARGAAGAAARGVADNITWICHDLSTWSTTETFDLVTASFLHSTVDLPRTAILRRAAGRIRPGGHLLVISHVFESDEDVPPWAWRHHGDDHRHPMHELLTPTEELAELGLEAEEWETVLSEIRSRTATGPDGEQQAMVKDGVVLLRRNRQP